jgi:hypothetical protein
MIINRSVPQNSLPLCSRQDAGCSVSDPQFGSRFEKNQMPCHNLGIGDILVSPQTPAPLVTVMRPTLFPSSSTSTHPKKESAFRGRSTGAPVEQGSDDTALAPHGGRANRQRADRASTLHCRSIPLAAFHSIDLSRIRELRANRCLACKSAQTPLLWDLNGRFRPGSHNLKAFGGPRPILETAQWKQTGELLNGGWEIAPIRPVTSNSRACSRMAASA